MKKKMAFPIALILVIIALSSFSSAHNGEQKALEYEIVYTGYFGLDANKVPMYIIGTTMHFEVHLKNIAKRTFRNIKVQAFQEYYSGEPMPESNSTAWNLESLLPGEEKILYGSYATTNSVIPGLDRTRLAIKHDNEGSGTGSEIINDSFAGIWCP